MMWRMVGACQACAICGGTKFFATLPEALINKAIGCRPTGKHQRLTKANQQRSAHFFGSVSPQLAREICAPAPTQVSLEQAACPWSQSCSQTAVGDAIKVKENLLWWGSPNDCTRPWSSLGGAKCTRTGVNSDTMHFLVGLNSAAKRYQICATILCKGFGRVLRIDCHLYA